MNREQKIQQAREAYEKAEQEAWAAVEAVVRKHAAIRQRVRDAYWNAMTFAQDDKE
jgi:hypothetical protein